MWAADFDAGGYVVVTSADIWLQAGELSGQYALLRFSTYFLVTPRPAPSDPGPNPENLGKSYENHQVPRW